MAEKILALNLNAMTLDEVFGFMNEVSHQIDDTFSEKPDCTKNFLNALHAFDEAMHVEASAFSGSDIQNADAEADDAWSGLNAYLKAMMNHPAAEPREAAEMIYHVFEQYENPTSLAYVTEYGIMERLVASLKEIPADVQKKANAVEWIENLSKKCSGFVQMYSLRIQEKAGKVVGANKMARLDAISAYREMIKIINVLLIISPDDRMESFAAHLNTLISARKAVEKQRKTRAANSAKSNAEDAGDGC